MFDQNTQNNNSEDVVKIVSERISMLPEKVQKEILDSGWIEAIRKISTENNLRIDQASVLENQTLMIMLALVSTKEFISNLKNEAEMSDDLANKLAEEVNTKVIHEIREHLISFSEKEVRDQEEKEEGQKTDVVENKSLEKISFNKSTAKETVSLDPYREPLE